MNSALFDGTVGWLSRTPEIKSAVLFGSSASSGVQTSNDAKRFSDLDFHLIVSRGISLEHVDWNTVLVHENACLRVCRPATGGVRKVTVIFHSGQLDIVVVPLAAMRIAAFGFRTGLYGKVRSLRIALDEMATCLRSGYQFIKGAAGWRKFYSQVASLPGVRLNDAETRNLADASVSDLLWVLQKIEIGELVAAQHILHIKLSDTNLRLWRELCIRNKFVLPSFGLGRGIEQAAAKRKLVGLGINARLDPIDIRGAAWTAFEGLKALMAELEPKWGVPRSMEALLAQYRY